MFTQNSVEETMLNVIFLKQSSKGVTYCTNVKTRCCQILLAYMIQEKYCHMVMCAMPSWHVLET